MINYYTIINMLFSSSSSSSSSSYYYYYLIRWKSKMKISDELFREKEIKLCLHYSQHVLNQHVSIPNYEINNIEDFI